jgi:hypothetical protein
MLRQLIALLVAFFIALLVFSWAQGFSSSFQHCVNDSTAQASQQNSKDQNSPVVSFVRVYVRCSERFADAHNALITAAATVLLAVITFGLILSGVDQQKTTRAQLRAYLSVESGVCFRQSQKRRGRFEFRPNIINNGQTPASDVRILSKIDLSPNPVPNGFNYKVTRPVGLPPGSTSAIAPGKEKFHSVVFPRMLTWSELKQHAKAQQWFHVWGEVTYNDIFAIKRHTYFSFLIYVPTKKSEQVLWLATDRHNYYD